MAWYGGWRPYVPVAKRRAKAATYAARLAKKEKRSLAPVKIEGRKIATSFWGIAWCDNLERYSDFANRLPRGRTYARNGSVIDLQVSRGTIRSIVSGSELYHITIEIGVLKPALWRQLKSACSNSIESLLDLLQGRFDQGVMQRLTQRDVGLFPQPKEIKMRCSCPDWAGLCKHVAATLYGVGARLDTAPELLFSLRGVDHLELISEAVGKANLDQALDGATSATLADATLGEVFGIDIELGSNGDSAAAGAAGGGKRKRVSQRTRNRQATAGSKPARPKKTVAEKDEAVPPDAKPEKERGKRSASKTARAKKAVSATIATGRTSKGKTSAAATSASTSARRPTTASMKKRPKAR